ncbi:MAG: hypothetical protein Q8S73_35320 [Deltaproteobacteria bacterium]|nr:hypothetical protein [Myxococcales bacterium]MDP3219425.1 hypothetical protein [Deltaproteobacteria bacterium]
MRLAALALALCLGCGRTVTLGPAADGGGGDVTEAPECADDLECDDAVVCTADRCTAGRCVRAVVPSRCGDGTVCDPARGGCVDPRCRDGGSPCEADGGVACVDLGASTVDCGACGVRCRAGDVCDRGACVPRARGASARCRRAGDCAEPYACDLDLGGVCALPCAPGDAADEARACGVGATCLSLGDGMGRCLRACDPRERTIDRGACASGQVCTALWLSNDLARLDEPACVGFCQSDLDCQGDPRGGRCSLRTGECGARADDGRLAADGTLCDPEALDEAGRSAVCRGFCARVGAAGRGLCASLFDRATRQRCYDDPATMSPAGPVGADNLGLCVYRACVDGCACGGGAACIFPEDGAGRPQPGSARFCLPPTAAQPVGPGCP